MIARSPCGRYSEDAGTVTKFMMAVVLPEAPELTATIWHRKDGTFRGRVQAVGVELNRFRSTALLFNALSVCSDGDSVQCYYTKFTGTVAETLHELSVLIHDVHEAREKYR